MDRVINDIHLTNIGDALRDTLGEGNQFPPKDMGEAVKVSNEVAFSNGYGSGYEEGEEFGYNTGFADGDEQGYNSGRTDGIEDGKLEERNTFWKALTNNGAKGVYYYTFCEDRWTKDNFKPTHNIVPTEADHMFYRHNYDKTAYDLAQQLEKYGGKLDFSNCTLGNYTFDGAVVSRLPELNMAKGTFTCFVRNCKSLVTIDKIICSSTGNQNFTQTFNGCSKLKNIAFEGVIGRSISFSVSPLSVESIKNIISRLKDYSGTDNEYTYTVTFKTSAFNALEAEGATAEYNGTACTWAELIGFKKWNLTKA